MKKQKLKMSIIIPVYNAEKYLEKCIDSIISQDVGFEKNIKLILINDGSTDFSAAICESYKKLFPNNVLYIEKHNGGVSSARNEGIKNVETQYFGFIDSDDYFSKDAISSVIDYFDNSQEKSVIAVIKVINFGDKKTPHPTNKKFSDKTEIHNLENPNSFDVCPRVAPAFFKTKYVKNYRFDEKVTIYEDTKFMSDIICNFPLVGIISKGIYFYRRFSQDSDFDTSITTGITLDKKFYNQTLKKISLYLLEKKEKNPKMSKYLDYMSLYTLRWLLLYNKTDPKNVLDNKEFLEYIKIKQKIFALISINAIASFELYNLWQKIYFLSLKENAFIENNLKINISGDILYRKNKIFNLKEDSAIYLKKYYIENNLLTIHGFFKGLTNKKINLKAKVNNEDFDNIFFAKKTNNQFDFENKKPYKIPNFVFKIPLSDKKTIISFFIEAENNVFPIKKIIKTKKSKKFKKTFIKEKKYYFFRTKTRLFIMNKNIFNYIFIKFKQFNKKIKKMIRRK